MSTANSDIPIAVAVKKRTRSDKGVPRAKKPGAALVDVIAALDGLDPDWMIKVLDAAKIFFDLKPEAR